MSGILPDMMHAADLLISTQDQQMQAVGALKSMAEEMRSHAGAIGHETLIAADEAIIGAADHALSAGLQFASALTDLAGAIQGAGGRL